jgi:hypothetical protein
MCRFGIQVIFLQKNMFEAALFFPKEKLPENFLFSTLLVETIFIQVIQLFHKPLKFCLIKFAIQSYIDSLRLSVKSSDGLFLK